MEVCDAPLDRVRAELCDEPLDLVRAVVCDAPLDLAVVCERVELLRTVFVCALAVLAVRFAPPLLARAAPPTALCA